jgi:hypothetical protein
MARRLEGQSLALILGTRPLDPALTPEAATLVADPSAELLRPSPLTTGSHRNPRRGPAVRRAPAPVCPRLPRGDGRQSVPGRRAARRGGSSRHGSHRGRHRRCRRDHPARGGQRGPAPLGPAHAGRSRNACPRAECTRRRRAGGRRRAIGRAGRCRSGSGDIGLVSAGVVESGGTVRFTHPILRTAIYGDLSPAERERLHRAAATILRERGASAGQIAVHVMHTGAAADPAAVARSHPGAQTALTKARTHSVCSATPRATR